MIGAAIFIASTFEGVKVHQKDIAVAIGVSIATIKNRYKELITKLEISAISKNEKKKSIIECPVCGMRVSLHVPKDWKIMAKKKLVRLNVQHENHGFIIQIEDSGRISLVSDLNSQK
jgi:hypothetical protein